jgi:putative DNA primase/helicase
LAPIAATMAADLDHHTLLAKIKPIAKKISFDIRAVKSILAVARCEFEAQNINRSGDGVEEPKRCVADKLVDIASDAGISYFQTEEQVIYADVRSEGRLNTWQIDGKDFKNWLRRGYFAQYGASVAGDAVNQAVATISAINDGECPECPVNVRAAKHDGVVYLDMRDRDCRAIKVTPNGWEITQDYPVRFKPGSGVELPAPVKGGDLALLRDLCGFDFDTWVKILMFLVQWLYPTKGYPIMFLVAPPQSGKTTIAEALKKLVDPSTINVRGTVSDPRDFAIQASQRRLILIDNLSHVSEDQSNMLCGVSTGSGFTTRTLHSNDEETVFKLNNPMIFTGIAAIASKGDLLSRGLTVELSAPEEMVSPEEFENRFEALRPRISGALIDLLSKVLGILPSVEGTYKGRERFGRFIELGLAVEQALEWPAGTVMRVVSAGRDAAHETAIDASPVGQALIELMLYRECWTGTTSKLLEELAAVAGEKTARGQYWPSDATRLAKKLNELKPNFAACGIEITNGKSNGIKTVTIERIATAATTQAQSEPAPIDEPPATAPKPGDTAIVTAVYEGLGAGQTVTIDLIIRAEVPRDDGGPGWFATCISKGVKHNVWIDHLQATNEADRLGTWEAAA